jgi:prolyl-tRNA synthetase
MKASQFHVSTLKEAPADAEIVSHQLMTRAGMIRKLAGGIYNYMPMGLRVIRRIEGHHPRGDESRRCAIELLMPVVQPAELWMESGRWEQVRSRTAAGEGPASSATSSSSRPRKR